MLYKLWWTNHNLIAMLAYRHIYDDCNAMKLWQCCNSPFELPQGTVALLPLWSNTLSSLAQQVCPTFCAFIWMLAAKLAPICRTELALFSEACKCLFVAKGLWPMVIAPGCRLRRLPLWSLKSVNFSFLFLFVAKHGLRQMAVEVEIDGVWWRLNHMRCLPTKPPICSSHHAGFLPHMMHQLHIVLISQHYQLNYSCTNF